MKPPTIIFALGLLLTGFPSIAQVVLQGDSIYHGLCPHKDSVASLVAQLGKQYRKRELLTFVHGLMSGGGDMHGIRLDGYALHYEQLGATFCVDNKTGRLFRIQLDAKAAVISARGIRPGIATFAMVIARYGPSQRGKEREGQPRVQEISFDRKAYFTALRYPHITFISLGRPKVGKNLLKREVQEIWLW